MLFLHRIFNFKLVFVFLILLGTACSKEEESGNEKIIPTACFTIARDTIRQGENLVVEDCSANGTTVTWRLNGGNVSLEDLNSFRSTTVGDNTIEQYVFYSDGAVTSSQDYYIEPVNSDYLKPSELTGYRSYAFGYNPVLDNIYAIVQNDESLAYVDISEDLDFSLTEIEYSETDRNVYAVALCSFEADGVVYLDIPYTTTATVQSYDYWVNPTTGETDNPISLVSNDFNANYVTINEEKYAVGANVKAINGENRYVPTINRINSGRITTLKEFDFGEKNGAITNMISYGNGYLGLAYSFDRAFNGLFDLKTLLLELDADFNLIETHELTLVGSTDTIISALIESTYMLNLPNDKILVFEGNSFRILNSDLTVSHEEVIISSSSRPELILLEDSFVFSTRNYIYKYDLQGNKLAELYYGDEGVEGFVELNGKILFMQDTLFEGIFIGMLDEDLNYIPFE